MYVRMSSKKGTFIIRVSELASSLWSTRAWKTGRSIGTPKRWKCLLACRHTPSAHPAASWDQHQPQNHDHACRVVPAPASVGIGPPRLFFAPSPAHALDQQAYVYLKRFLALALEELPKSKKYSKDIYVNDRSWLKRVRA